MDMDMDMHMCMCMYAHVIWFPKVTARICSSEHARSASVRLRCREVGVCRGVDAEGACHLTVDCRFPSFAGLNEARPLWYTRQHGSAPGLGHQRILGGWAVKGRTASRLEHSGDSKLSLRRRRTTHELLELTWVRVMCLDVLLGAGAGLLAARAQAAAAAVEDWVVVAANCVLVAASYYSASERRPQTYGPL